MRTGPLKSLLGSWKMLGMGLRTSAACRDPQDSSPRPTQALGNNKSKLLSAFHLLQPQ